jgi:hypothetical protein
MADQELRAKPGSQSVALTPEARGRIVFELGGFCKPALNAVSLLL